MSDESRLIADRYRLDERIGSGAMGVVWRAHDERLDRTVAVKQLLLKPGLSTAEAEQSHARAMREGRIAARLQHPHAISVFDVALGPDGEGGEGTEPWLIMEYLPSRSLATVLAEQGQLPPREVARIGRQVADGLAAAHSAGIVHRDIKPGNVLLGEDGTVKITDFGISRASWDVTVTRTGFLAGTPAYFAPEVARGQDPTAASDVFSLGATLYTAVEGEPPFGLDENTLALLRAVADGNVRPPQRAGPLSAVLMRLLRDEPAERPVMAAARDMLGMVASSGSTAPTATAGMPAPPSRTVAVPPPAGPPWRSQPSRSQPSPPPERPAPSTAGAPWWQQRSALVAAALLLVLVFGAVGFAVTGGDPDPTTAAPAPPAPSAPGPATPTPTPEPTPSPTPAPTPAPAPAPPPAAAAPPAEPGPEQFEQTVRDYYALLPDQLDAAYSYLGPAVREQAGGRDGYEAFWSQFSDVGARNVQADGSTVSLTIVYTRPDGTTFTEPYLLEMGTADDGRIIITRSQIGGSGGTSGDDDG